MSLNSQAVQRIRPFPWPCAHCATLTVVPTSIPYAIKVKHDGALHEFKFPELEVPCCQMCGEISSTTAIDDRVNDALRERLRLLTPDQMRQAIEALGLEPQELAEKLGVTTETVARWVDGDLIQSRAMDNLLRLYFAIPAVRAALRGAEQDPNFGAAVVGV